MNIVQFALMVNRLTFWGMRELTMYEMSELNGMVQPEVNPSDRILVSEEVVNDLLLAMAGGQKIEAIKAYRTITGVPLKEAKDIVEKYWISKVPS